MSFVGPPGSDDDDVVPVKSPPKSKSYRDALAPDTPSTTASSNMSSVGSPIAEASNTTSNKRGLRRTNNTSPSKRAAVAVPTLKDSDLRLDDTKSITKIDLKDFVSSSEGEDDEEDDAPKIWEAVWYDREQQAKWYQYLHDAEEKDVPDDLKVVVEKNIKKLKVNDLKLALVMITGKQDVPVGAANMRKKLIDKVLKALDKYAAAHKDVEESTRVVIPKVASKSDQ